MIDQIKNTLNENKVSYSEKAGWLIVKPESPNGFEVGYAEDEHFAYVYCSGWHEEFEDAEEAKNCFLNALTDRVRIIVSVRGSYEYKWEYQALENETWKGFGATCLLLVPFWRKANECVKQNNLLN